MLLYKFRCAIKGACTLLKHTVAVRFHPFPQIALAVETKASRISTAARNVFVFSLRVEWSAPSQQIKRNAVRQEKAKNKEYLVSMVKGCEGCTIATLFQNPTYGVCWNGPIVKKHCLFHTRCPKNLPLSKLNIPLLFGSQQTPYRGVVIMSAADQHWSNLGSAPIALIVAPEPTETSRPMGEGKASGNIRIATGFTRTRVRRRQMNGKEDVVYL